MDTPTDLRKKPHAALWWLGAMGALLLVFLALRFSCGNDADRIIRSVPIGTRLSDLDGYLSRWNLDPGDVMQWSPTNEPPDREDIQIHLGGVRIKTEFGTFLQEDLGAYDAWMASAKERDRFTGEVTFFHMSHWNAELIGFTFINGKLVKKDWGFLPG